MEEKSELGDIILNKDSKEGGSKKVILAAAALGVILIVVVLLMNTLSNEPQNNLPQQAALPPKPVTTQKSEIVKEEPLFEDVEVVDETNQDEEDLEQIAKKLKQQSKETPEPKVEVVQKPKVAKETQTVQKTPKTTAGISKQLHYYIQVGSFTKQPDKKFLAKIKQNGYNYRLYKTTIRGKKVTKVLIGPFGSKKAARAKLSDVRKKIIRDAFLARI